MCSTATSSQSNNEAENTHTHTFNSPFSGNTRVSRYQKGKTNLEFTDARDGEWQWHQLGHMQVYISLQTDNHASIPPLSFLQAGCPSCRPTNSVKALKGSNEAENTNHNRKHKPVIYFYTFVFLTGTNSAVQRHYFTSKSAFPRISQSTISSFICVVPGSRNCPKTSCDQTPAHFCVHHQQ